jgi:hypothetical protein
VNKPLKERVCVRVVKGLLRRVLNEEEPKRCGVKCQCEDCMVEPSLLLPFAETQAGLKEPGNGTS